MHKFGGTRNILPTVDVEANIQIIANAAPKYTNCDWELNNTVKFEISENQQKLAQRLLDESHRVVDEVNYTTNILKKNVDYNLLERTTEIKFLIDGLNKQRKIGATEEDNLKTYRNRLLKTNSVLTEEALTIIQKCIIFRDGRKGTDLCVDEVDLQLRQELKVINGCQGLLGKALNLVNEQIRGLKATLYLLDRDLSAKGKSLKIDETNLSLKENQQQLSVYHGNTPLDISTYSLDDWKDKTYKNIENTSKELNSAGELRAYINLVMRQLIEDLEKQRDRTNEAFERRITEVKKIKEDLEATHSDTIKHIMEIRANIEKLEMELANKQGFLALCQMRLGNRAQRPELELTSDDVQESLLNELKVLKLTIEKLTNKLVENKAALRYLLQVQIMQEEELNIKTNTIKIDEVNCMSIRKGLVYKSY